MSDGMGREFTYLSSHATNRYFIPNWGRKCCHHSKDAQASRYCHQALGRYLLTFPARSAFL